MARHTVEALQRVAIDGMDRDALAGGDDADDAFAGQRMAAAGIMDGHARDQAPDADAGFCRRRAIRLLPARSRFARLAGFAVVGTRREQFVDDFRAGEASLADANEQIVLVLDLKGLDGPGNRLLGQPPVFLPERLVENPAAKFPVFVPVLDADEAPDPRSGLAGRDKTQPVRRRLLRLRGQDLDLIAVDESRLQRNHAAVDLHAGAPVADLGMDGIGEIDRRCAMGQRDQVAARREAEHLVPEHLELGVFQELVRPLGLLHDVEQFAQPAILRRIGLAFAVFRLLLVRPVRRQPVFGEIVHLAGADLDLDPVPVRTDHRGVDRAIAVRLRQADIVLEPAGTDPPGAMNRAERAVAVLNRVELDRGMR